MWRGTHCSPPAGIAENSHLRKQNYFYYNCITGHFLRDNCPSYLREENFNRLKDGLLNRLTISTGFFLEELRARKYSKVGGCNQSAPLVACLLSLTIFFHALSERGRGLMRQHLRL